MLRSMYCSRSGFERFLSREKTSKPAIRAPATKLPATAPENVAIDSHELEDCAWGRLLLGSTVLVADAAKVDETSAAEVVLKFDASRPELRAVKEALDAELLDQVLTEIFLPDDKPVETGVGSLSVETATELTVSPPDSEIVEAVEGEVKAEGDEGLASRLEDELVVTTSGVMDLSV